MLAQVYWFIAQKLLFALNFQRTWHAIIRRALDGLCGYSCTALGEEIPALSDSSNKLAAEMEEILTSVLKIDSFSHGKAEVSEISLRSLT